MDLWLVRLVLTHLHPNQQQQQHLLQKQTLEPRVSIFLFPPQYFLWQAAFLPFLCSVTWYKSNSLYFNPVQHLDGHIPTFMNYCVHISYRVVFIIVGLLFSFVRYFDSFVHCLTIYKKYSVLTLDCIPGIWILLYINHHHLCKSINIIHQIAPFLS